VNGVDTNNHAVVPASVGGSHNDHVTDQVDGARPREARTGRETRQPSLGPWTQAVRQVVQNIGATHRAIKDLEDRFRSHLDDLTDTDETRNTLTKLKGECSKKDEQLTMLENTIAILRSIDTKAKADIEQS
jgi:chromosome segregation ATPase